MNKVVFHLGYLLIASVLISIFSIATTFAIINNFYEDGFDKLEISFMAVLPGLIFFVVVLLFNTIFEIRYLRACELESKIPVKMIFQVIYASFYVVLIALAFDAVYYYLIDDSIAIEYADGLKNIMIADGKDFDASDLDGFSRMPYLLQNIFALGFFCALANVIALPLGRTIYKTVYKVNLKA